MCFYFHSFRRNEMSTNFIVFESSNLCVYYGILIFLFFFSLLFCFRNEGILVCKNSKLTRRNA